MDSVMESLTSPLQWGLAAPGDSTFLWGLAAVLVAGYLAWHFAVYGNNGAGPTVFPFVGTLPGVLSNFETLYDYLTAMMEKSPTMSVFITVPLSKEVFTANPVHIEHILKDNFANYPKGYLFTEVCKDLLGHGIFNVDGEEWKQQRKIASYEFSTHSLRDLMHVAIQEEIGQRLLPTLEKFAQEKQPLDMQDILLRFSFDNICRIGFGYDAAALLPELPDVAFVQSFDRAMATTMVRSLLPMPFWKFVKLLNVGPEAQLAQDIAVINDFANDVIKKRKAELAAVREGKKSAETVKGALGQGSVGLADGHTDILSRMLLLGEKDHGQLFTDTFLRDACINFIMAGRDTTATALSWLFWSLTQHPEVEAKILEEIRGIVAKRGSKAKPGSDTSFSFDELKVMTYTHAAINETLRLYPSVPGDFKVAQNDDVLPDGTRIGKGWRVLYLLYGVGRMTRVWGPDAAKFKPERWIAADGQLKTESPFKFIAFNGGPRLCLGRDMAYMQMKLVVSSVLLRYRLQVLPGHQVSYTPTVSLLMRDGLKVTVAPRE